MRVDKEDTIGLTDARELARSRLNFLIRDQFGALVREGQWESLDEYWTRAEQPYYPRYAIGEKLAFFCEVPYERNTLLRDIMWLVSFATGFEFRFPASIVPFDARDHYIEASRLRDQRDAEVGQLAALHEDRARLKHLIDRFRDQRPSRVPRHRPTSGETTVVSTARR